MLPVLAPCLYSWKTEVFTVTLSIHTFLYHREIMHKSQRSLPSLVCWCYDKVQRMSEGEIFIIWDCLMYDYLVQIHFDFFFLSLFCSLWTWNASNSVWKMKNGSQSCLPDCVYSSCARTYVLLWIPHLLFRSAAGKWCTLLTCRTVVRNYQ